MKLIDHYDIISPWLFTFGPWASSAWGGLALFTSMLGRRVGENPIWKGSDYQRSLQPGLYQMCSPMLSWRHPRENESIYLITEKKGLFRYFRFWFWNSNSQLDKRDQHEVLTREQVLRHIYYILSRLRHRSMNQYSDRFSQRMIC